MSFFSEYKVAQELVATHYPVICYAESRYYYQYFELLLADLLQQGVPVLYITSDKNDPLLTAVLPGLKVVYIHWWLGFVFPRLKAVVVIMTMTDLDNYAFKRSKDAGCYVYVFHAMVSTHQQYSANAFYHYDAIFCPGPLHAAEIKAAEIKYQQKRKDIIAYGYPLADLLKGKVQQHNTHEKHTKPVILIAPSWYQGCIFETCIEELVQQLAVLPYLIVIRPHPEYVKRRQKKMKALQKLTAKFSTISFDYDAAVLPALLKADVLITDRSGIALEYALGIQKPVLFIDTLLKVMNPAWKELGLIPVESQIRSQIGVSILPGQLNEIGRQISLLEDLKKEFPARMELLQKELLFNSNMAYQAGVAYVLSKIKRQ